MIKEHERVVLTVAVPGEGLEPGDVGTVRAEQLAMRQRRLQSLRVTPGTPGCD
jgi:hypothetical protein